MLDFFRIGLALLGLWLTAVWQSLPFWQQAMLCAIPLLVLQWCIRKLWQAFLAYWDERARQQYFECDDFREFYLDLWKISGLDYTREEAIRLFAISRTNRELANHMAEV